MGMFLQQSLEQVIDGIKAGTWQWNLETGRVIVNRYWFEMLGYPSERNWIDYAEWEEMLHPEDKLRVSEAVKTHLAGTTHVYEIEFRLRHRDGSWVWIQARGRRLKQEIADNDPYFCGTHIDITQKKGTEQEIESGRRKYQLLFEQSTDALLFLDENASFIECNPAGLDVYGCSEDSQIIGCSPMDFSPAFQPDGMESKLKALNYIEAARRGEPQAFEWVHSKKDGTPFHARVQLNRLINGGAIYLQAIVRDVTETKAREGRLLLLEQAISASPVAIMVTDRDGTIEYTNPFFTFLTGYGQHETLGANPNILKSGEQDEEFYASMWKTILSGQVWIGTFCNRHKNGALFWEKAFISPTLDSKGAITHFVAVFYDISAQKRSEELIAENLRMKDDFISNVSHELRTPLFSILGFSSILLNEEHPANPETRKEFLSIIQSETRRLSALIENVLTISRIDAGKVLSDKAAIELQHELKDVAAGMEILAKEKGITLVLHQQAGPVPINGEADAIRRVFINIIGNALKFTSKGGSVTITMTIAIADNGSIARIEVKDTGCGIPEKDIPHIFEKFYRGKKENAQIAGTGLGLSIVKTIIEEHEGTIAVESAPEKGTRFTISLPILQSSR